MVKNSGFLKRFVRTWDYEDTESWNPFPACCLQQDHKMLPNSFTLPPGLSCLLGGINPQCQEGLRGGIPRSVQGQLLCLQ